VTNQTDSHTTADAPANAPGLPVSLPPSADPAELFFGVHSTQGNYGPDDLRWTPRRIRNTAWYAIIGTLIGVLMGAVMFTIMLIFARLPITAPGLIIGLLLLSLGPLGIFRASDGTCRATPVAPRGISIGLSIGAMFAIPLGLQLFRPLPLVIALALAMGTGFFAAGYYGGKRGVRRRFGLPQLGVGIVCAHCGYDLSATPNHAVCPECGGQYRYAAMPPQ